MIWLYRLVCVLALVPAVVFGGLMITSAVAAWKFALVICAVYWLLLGLVIRVVYRLDRGIANRLARRRGGVPAGEPGLEREPVPVRPSWFSEAKGEAIAGGVFFILLGVSAVLLSGGDIDLIVFGLFFAGIGICETFILDADAAAARRAQRKQRRMERRQVRLTRRDAVPVKAVLVTAGMGQKNRMRDAAAGMMVFGTLGALAGLTGETPPDLAVFYVTWSDGHTTAERVRIQSRRFLELMKLTGA